MEEAKSDLLEAALSDDENPAAFRKGDGSQYPALAGHRAERDSKGSVDPSFTRSTDVVELVAVYLNSRSAMSGAGHVHNKWPYGL